MKQFLTVLKFELSNYFKNKSFVVTTVPLMVLAVGIIAVPGFLMGRDSSSGGDSNTGGNSAGAEQKTVAVLDENGSIADLNSLARPWGCRSTGQSVPIRNRWRTR